MRNNKIIDASDIKVGTRVKIALPTWYARKSKELDKTYSWFKAKVVAVYDKTFVLTIYPKWFIGRMLCKFPPTNIVKCK